jgi:hypothetical protein
MAAALIVAAPMLLSDRPIAPANYLASALIGVASLFIARLFWTGRAFGGGVAAAVLGAVFAWTMLGAVLPQLSHIDVSSRLSRALSEAGRHPLEDHLPPAALAGYHEPSAVFLLGTRTKLTNGAAAARDLAAGRVSAAIIEARETGAFLDAAEDAKLQPAPLAVVEGLNYSNGQRVALTIFIRGEKN